MDAFSMAQMTIYHWILLAGFATCLASCLYHFFRIIGSGVPGDKAVAKGKIGPAVAYSFTKGMSPKKKETAFLHLPTYAAGLLFHLGTFFGFAWLILIFLGIELHPWIDYISAGFLSISGLTGLGILIKRMINRNMHSLSNPDDYISNLLVSGFHLLVGTALILTKAVPALFIYSTVLFLYIPLGKLRHMVYFFTSRFHLGVFYGRRGTWPVKKQRIWEEN
jgi:hypothetical protein